MTPKADDEHVATKATKANNGPLIGKIITPKEKDEPMVEKDIYLLNRPIFAFNFAPVPHVYSPCPFAIKLESFLRINGIPYESIYGAKFSSKGMMPYIRLDHPDEGTEIPDSNMVIGRLLEELGKSSSDSHLTPQQRAMTHFLIRMLEEHTQQIGFYYRYGLQMESFLDALDIEHRFRPGASKYWGNAQPQVTLNKTKIRGLSRHSDEDIWKFSNDDIQAISDVLGDEQFLLGGDKPTLADCAVFGHLSQFLWIPIDFPQRKYLLESCPNLVKFMNHFRATYWPDWEDLCNIKLDYANGQSCFRKKHMLAL